jgi:hypothetical protein
MVVEPLGGNVTKIPGVSKKNRTKTYKIIKKYMILYIGIKNTKIAKDGCIMVRQYSVNLY